MSGETRRLTPEQLAWVTTMVRAHGMDVTVSETAITHHIRSDSETRRRLEAAYEAGFQWGVNGTDRDGDYNGGPPEQGFEQFLAALPAAPPPDGWIFFCPKCAWTGAVQPVHPSAAPPPTDDAHAYLSRLLTSHAPQCEPLPDLMGLCSQIDNLLTGLRTAPPPEPAPAGPAHDWRPDGEVYRCVRCLVASTAPHGPTCPVPRITAAPPPDLVALVHEFVAYYSRGGGCSNCGGLPHSTTCFVGRFALALAEDTDGGGA